jgi:hypothetical protein
MDKNDLRMSINEMLYSNSNLILTWPQLFKRKLAILAGLLDSNFATRL